LVYQTGGSGHEKELSWFDRSGKRLGVTGEAADYFDLRLSPDGQKLAFNVGSPYSEIFAEDLSRGVRMRLTVDPDADHGIPVWAPDDSRILFSTVQGKAPWGIYQKRANGAGSEELLLTSESQKTALWPTSWSRDGRYLLYGSGNSFRGPAEIWVLTLDAARRRRLAVKAQSAYDAQFSPDGRWVAYTSGESGRGEVYLVPFGPVEPSNSVSEARAPSDKWQISPGGGRCPRWRGDGKEIFYLSPANQVMSAQVEEKGSGMAVRTPQVLFGSSIDPDSFSPYDVTPDGKKFVINTVIQQNAPLTIVVNWAAKLHK